MSAPWKDSNRLLEMDSLQVVELMSNLSLAIEKNKLTEKWINGAFVRLQMKIVRVYQTCKLHQGCSGGILLASN